MHKNDYFSRLPSPKVLAATFGIALLTSGAAQALDNTHGPEAVKVHEAAKEAGIQDACSRKPGQKLARLDEYSLPFGQGNIEQRVQEAGYYAGVTAVKYPLDGEQPCKEDESKETAFHKPESNF